VMEHGELARVLLSENLPGAGGKKKS